LANKILLRKSEKIIARRRLSWFKQWGVSINLIYGDEWLKKDFRSTAPEMRLIEVPSVMSSVMNSVMNSVLGIVLVTHGGLATAFVDVLEHVLGKQQSIIALGIEPHDNLTSRRADIVRAIKEVDHGHGVVVLTDMFGGTPSNLAIAAMQGRPIEVIAGVNLPMLIKLVEARSAKKPLHQVVLEAQEAGRRYIHVAGGFLEGVIT
jgi:PTS system mannose-specific IIA component